MISLVTALRWVARLDFLAALILGIVLWTGSPGSLKSHILTGFIMTITLLLIGLLGFFARIKPALPIIAIAWAILLPYIGFAQIKQLASLGITIQVIHLLIGICSVGIVEACAARTNRQLRA